MTVESTFVDTTSRREINRARAVEVMRMIQENIAQEDHFNVTMAAEAAEVAPSTFYRWLKRPPQKIDVTAVAALADYLHDVYGHKDFTKLWRDAMDIIK